MSFLYKLTSLKMRWLTVIILSAAVGVYAGLASRFSIINPELYGLAGINYSDLSFGASDIMSSLGIWIFFGLLIVVNQNKWWLSGLKCVVFFLLSHAFICLIGYLADGAFDVNACLIRMQWLLLALPLGCVMHFAKFDNILGDLLLSAPLAMLVFCEVRYAVMLFDAPPARLVSCIFCALQTGFWLYTLKSGKGHLALTALFMLLLAIIPCGMLL